MTKTTSKPSDTVLAGTDRSPEVVFAAVPTEDAVTAVVRRLRAAIALGVLADGDRLPREANLASQLGVTAFALREALCALRDEGLITTRRGQGGGSFVSHTERRSRLMYGELRAMSATELHDLGDWRQILASGSAWLAARRASGASANRLREYAEAVGSAENALEAWRAHGRFHLELAAAAQSIRMTQAEFRMYEEFDWLLELALADPQRRQATSTELLEVAEAVANRAPDAARAAVERHSASTVQALVRQRLASIAADYADLRAESEPEASGASDELNRMLSALTTAIDAVAVEAEAVIPGAVDVAQVRSALSRVAIAALVDGGLGLDGIGFLADPTALQGGRLWTAWWHVTSNGIEVDDTHVLDPERADFYDYTAYDYFTVPRRSGELWAHGPYVDYGGVDDYIITFSRPVYADDRFVGVSGADMPVSTIESRLAPWLAVSDEVRIVVNADRRVIAGNSADHVVGDILPADVGVELERLPRVGWSVVTEVPCEPCVA